MSYQPNSNDNENQSLRKINALAASLTADVADGVTVNGLTDINAKLPALNSGRIPVDIGSIGTVTVSNEVEVKNDLNSPIPISDNNSSLTVDGTVTANAGTGTFAISAAALPLPAGASTESTLSSVNTKLPSLASGRVPVDGSGVTQPISGTVTANAGTGNFTVVQGTHANLKGQIQILDSSGNQVTYAATGTAGTPAADVVTVQGVSGGTALPVSGTVTANAGTGTFAVRPRNGSVTVVAGSTDSTPSTSAEALGANSSRQYLYIQNNSDTDMYFNFGATATTSHLLVKAGASVAFDSGFVPTDAVNSICGSASKSYYILHS